MRTSHVLLVLAVLGVSALAGCMGAQDGAAKQQAGREARRISGVGGFVGEPFAGSVDVNRSAQPDYDFSTVVLGDHGAPGLHAVRELHTHHYGLDQAGYSPLVEGKDPTAYDSGFTALDVWDDGTNYYVCVTHFAGNGGADIADITDPASIKTLGHIDSGMVNSDCQFTDDGKYLFLGAYLGLDPMNQVHQQLQGSLRALPVAGAYDLLANGVSVWDVSDKSNPEFLFFSYTGTYHNLFTVTINDTYYLLQTYSNNIYRFDPDGGGRLAWLNKTSTMVHDMTVSRHPITGDWLLYTGKGSGIAVINLNDPEHPQDLGEWAPASGGGHAVGWHEQEVIPQLVDGRALLIVAGETGGGNTLPYGVIDVTDPYNPTLLSEWIIPGSPSGSDPNFFTFSPHEIGTWNGYVAVANYHAGVWLFDVGSAERVFEPVTIGQFYGSEEPVLNGAPQNPPFAFNPDHWGAYFDSRGYVVTADWGSGLYVVKFDKTGTWAAPPTREDA